MTHHLNSIRMKTISIVMALGFLMLASCSSTNDTITSKANETDRSQKNPESVSPQNEASTPGDKLKPGQYDWSDFPVPALASEGKRWTLLDISDDFNDDASANHQHDSFAKRWNPEYHNQWKGPGLTEWDRQYFRVSDGNLQIFASRKTNSQKINMGCLTSRNQVQFPVFVEVRAKIMNSTLASCVWLLSPDDTQEIDIVEAYGAKYSQSAKRDHKWFAERVHVGHHVFIREPFQDYQPKDEGAWVQQNGKLWHQEFHRFGVYWRDPWHLEYYIDGKKVRTVSGKKMIDPKHFTNSTNPGDTTRDSRTGLSKPMDIILNIEDQTWRSTPPSGKREDRFTPTDSELKNTEDHTMLVDWIRIYQAVDKE